MKRGIKCIILICMIAIIGGCSSNNKKNNTNSDLEKQSKINIEDIDWKVKQGIVDGDRYALLDYTNNTPYTITHFELTFEEKDDLKEEDKEKFYKHIKDVVNADDEGMEEIKNKKMQKAFNQNHIELLFLDNKQELLNYLDSLLKDDQTVGVGGSMTLFETGVINYLRNKPVRFLDRYQEGLSRDEIEDVFHQSLLADVYLTSSNAIDRNGNLYNIDGNGNRVAAMIYGPKKVIVIVGMNKIFDDEDSAIQHIKNISCPANALRLHKNTPCVQVGKCVDCQSDDRICSAYVKIARQPLSRMTVLVINEELGY
mgnify:CR=1 FL=1